MKNRKKVFLFAETKDSRKEFINLFNNECFSLDTNFSKDTDFSSYDLVVMGGGIATDFAKSIGMEKCREMEDYIHSGGRFLGVCAGAYFALHGYSKETSWFQISSSEVVDVEHWRRGEEQISIKWKDGTLHNVYYCNGPLMDTSKSDDVVCATYEHGMDDLSSGKIAALQGSFGSGRFYVFGFHPELSNDKKLFLEDAFKYLFRSDDLVGKIF